MDKEGNEIYLFKVSVPIGGLFNLILSTPEIEKEKEAKTFPSLSRDYLI